MTSMTSTERTREWRERNRERVRAYNKSQQRMWRFKNRERAIFGQLRARARREGIEFTLTLEDIVVPENCPVLGIPLSWGGPVSRNTPSVDRIDNNKGYVKGNICIVSLRANSLKSDASLEEMEAILDYMRRGLKEQNENKA